MDRYEVVVDGVPDGCMREEFICGPSNGDGSPDKAKRCFATYEEAKTMVREFESWARRNPEEAEGLTIHIEYL